MASYRLFLQHLRTQRIQKPKSGASRQRCMSTQALLTRLRARFPNTTARDLPSLTASFLILHEISAVVPLVFGFFAFKYAGVGEAIIAWTTSTPSLGDTKNQVEDDSRMKKWARDALQESEEKAEKVGRYYGWFGYERRNATPTTGDTSRLDIDRSKTAIGGDVTNLVASYLIVKALFPIRIAFSLALTPSVARYGVSKVGVLRKYGERILKKTPTS